MSSRSAAPPPEGAALSTRALYRTLVPAHSGVDNDLIDAMLAQSIAQHSSSQWGAVYASAMVWHAAHRIQKLPGSGTGQGAVETGNVVAQSDAQSSPTAGSSTLSRSYSAPMAREPDEAELQTMTYGQAYLELRRSRKATLPMVVRP